MRKLENKKIDELGKILVKASAIRSREIEKIVADPGLFEGVRQRIAANGIEQVTGRRFVLRPAVAAVATVILVAISFAAFVSLRSAKPSDVVSAPEVEATPRQEPTIRRSSEGDTVVERPVSRPAETTPRLERASSRTAAANTRTNRSRYQASRPARVVDDFYAVSYAGDPHETERGSRIIRVDIPRSTLFAMGINVPLENESATVKADLLIGNDGVTRAIRVVE